MRKVACVYRKDLPNKFLQQEYRKKCQWEDIGFTFRDILFFEKTDAETNENLKQIIPYALLMNSQYEFGFYKRIGNESRLHGLWSAGFGGHIEDFDYSEVDTVQSLVEKALIRELNEEFSVEISYDLQFRGIINEELTKVGRTHLGLVFLALVDENYFTASSEITQIEWVSIHDIKNFKKEIWSKLAIELVASKPIM